MKSALGVIAGIVVGSIVNMGLIIAGSEVVPAPVGVDVADMESLKTSMHLFEPRHFLFPFLAHALGTMVGALTVSKLANDRAMRFALGVGAFFMLGGVANTFMLPAPVWFIALDLAGAYLPMAWLGCKLAARL